MFAQDLATKVGDTSKGDFNSSDWLQVPYVRELWHGPPHLEHSTKFPAT